MAMRARLSLVALLVTAAAFGSDWLQWRGPDRTGRTARRQRRRRPLGEWLLFLTNGGELLVLEADAESFSPERRYAVADTPTWAHPVPTPAGVLVKDESRLALWKLAPLGKLVLRFLLP